jgi:hypothetical protein
MTTTKENLPSTPRAEYVAAAPDVALIRDLLAGTRRMWHQHTVYIPKYKAEKPASYKTRATLAKVYGGLGRTLSASVGMLFARPPARSDTWTPDIEEHWENLDGRGTHGDVLAKRKAEDAIADGFTAILVDFPSVDEGTVVTAANEKTLNLRPLWCTYARSDILSWRTSTVDNVETLTQIVLQEGATAPKGRFGTVTKLRYRVCSLNGAGEAVWELLEERKEASGEVIVVSLGKGAYRDKNGAPFRVIPIAVAYAGRTDATLTAHPPLLDVAWVNLEHWRVATNLRYYEDLCCFPQPTVEGEIKPDQNGQVPQFQLGPGVLINVTQGSKFIWTEVTGGSITALRNSLQEKKDEMGEMGASFLAKKTRGVETAEAKRLDATAENSTLATAAQGIEDGINLALGFHAMYLGIPKEEAPTITINRDFDNITMDPMVMAVYVSAVKDTGFPIRLLLEAWQEGGRISQDEDLDKLELEINANAAAIAEQERQAAADALALKQPPQNTPAPKAA